MVEKWYKINDIGDAMRLNLRENKLYWFVADEESKNELCFALSFTDW